MTSDDVAIVVHDTYIIVDASAKFCALFRCERKDLIDRKVLDLVDSEEFKWLVELRMTTLRNKGRVPPARLPFRRFDNTCFWAQVTLTGTRAEGLYEITFQYEFEAPC